MEKKAKYDVQDLNANYVHKLLEIVSKAALNGISVIDEVNIERYKTLEYRDAYYNIVNKINTKQNLGHAICLVGLRRTGKSILLDQLHLNAEEFGIKANEILHLTLSVIMNGKEVTRDFLDCAKLTSEKKIEYPSLEDVKMFIEQMQLYKNIKCIMIDEITLCKDLILAGKGFIDLFVNSGITVILAGTESASFNLASENSLYSRVILEDISYIPFGEYCRLKKIPVSSLEEKQRAMDRYIEHGNILDDTVDIDDKYIESAVGVNVALSIINSDYEEFIGNEHNVKELVQSIIKYFKLLGESITVNNIKAEITRADLTRALRNENGRRKREGNDLINISKMTRNQIVVEATEEIFKEYDLDFNLSQIPLTHQQLSRIDELFTQMGLIYNMSIIPEHIATNGAVDADDLTILHALSYNITKNIANKVLEKPLKLSDEDIQILAEKIKSTAKGKFLEGIVTLQFIKAFEGKAELLTCLKSYENGKFETERKCTKHKMYKYNNKIVANESTVNAEIDIVLTEPEIIKLIEIKKSTVVDEQQTRWLSNEVVINEIREKVSKSKPIKKYVYYLGKEAKINDVYYKNIVDELLNHYDLYFRRV